MWRACLLTLVLGVGYQYPATQQASVDLIEFNHFVEKRSGKVLYDQVIVWYYDAEDGEYHVLDWALRDDKDAGFSIRHTPGGTRVTFTRESTVGKSKTVRWVLFSKLYRETYTTYDPEREDRKTHGNKGNLWTSPLDTTDTTKDSQ